MRSIRNYAIVVSMLSLQDETSFPRQISHFRSAIAPPSLPAISRLWPWAQTRKVSTDYSVPMKLLLTVALPLYLLDQFTKWLIVLNFPLHSYKTIIPGFFDLVHVTNTGAAFGSFSDSNVFFSILSCLVGATIMYFFLKGSFKDRLSRLGAVLLISGIAGNLTDRLVHGHVIDFLSFDLHVPYANPWPSFNVADSCICAAAILFLAQSVFEGKRSAGSNRGADGRP